MRTRACLIIVALALLVLSGCASQKPMNSVDMYSAPNFDELMPDYITGIRLDMNPLLEVADTALYPDFGFPESTSWPFFLVNMNQKNMKKVERYLAVNVPLPDGKKIPLVFLPGTPEDFPGKGGFVSDHACRRLISVSGEMMYVPDWADIAPANLKDIIKPVAEMNTIVAKKGTKQYEDLLSLLEPFQHEEAAKLAMGKKVTNDYQKAYGMKVTSYLDPISAKILSKDESYKEKMISLLGDNWFAIITYPLWTPEQYGMSILITKVFQIPTKFWKFDVNRPGYMDRELTAVQGAAMIDLYDRTYGWKSKFSPEDLELMYKILESYRASK